MYRHLPPLNALRAFEAAARHQSFTRAAEELFVTQGAISRQVRNLEDFFGAKLFSRGSHEVSLTDVGQSLAPAASRALEALDRSAEALLSDRNVLRLQVMPTFAVRWLMPRLADFTDLHRRIDLRATVTLHPQQFDAASFDAGIIYGDGAWPGLEAHCLARECLAPVIASDQPEGAPLLQTPADLRHYTLLHTSTDRRDWPWWLSEMGASDVPAREGPAFETLDMAVRAAEAGFGIALGDLSLIAEDIVEGRLRLALPRPQFTGRGAYFVCPSGSETRSGVIALRDWLLANAPIAKQPERQFL